MEKLVDFLLNFYGPTPYFVIFGILLACGLGLPIPEDITLFAAGLLSYYGLTDVWTMIIVCLVGVMVGDSLIFMLGAVYGRKLTKKWFFHKLLPDDRLELVKKQFHDRGTKLIFFARFMPGLRAPIFFSAGTLHLPYRVFFFYDGGAALLSVPAIVGAVYYFGDQLDRVVKIIQRVEHGIVLVVIAVVLAVAAKWYLGHRKSAKLRNAGSG
ncbi:MAG: DedA family protein [Oligoflexia bacterium]|nr:DedA family protein [Oligoflexia bacterium]